MTPQANPVTTTPLSDRPLTAEDVTLLREGDRLLLRYGNGEIMLFRAFRGGKLDVFCENHQALETWSVDSFTFVSRPTANVETGASEGGVDRIAELAWRFAGNDRLGGPWYEGAKPTDSPAMRDTFAFASAIAALTPSPPVQLSEREREAVAGLEKSLRAFIAWGEAQCPCYNDLPNPCPLCDASIENLEGCKAVEKKFPPRILGDAREALSRASILAALTRTTGEG